LQDSETGIFAEQADSATCFLSATGTLACIVDVVKRHPCDIRLADRDSGARRLWRDLTNLPYSSELRRLVFKHILIWQIGIKVLFAARLVVTLLDVG